MPLSDAQFTAWLKSATAVRTALVEVVARVSGSETTRYLSTRNYLTTAADTPASTAYSACISGGLQFTEELSLNGEPSISYGDIEIANPGGVRDAWLDDVWAGRACKVYVGDPTWSRADFRLVFDGVVADIASRARDVLNLRLRDKLQRLNVPVTESTLGGSTDNKDRLLPLTFGECSNVEPLLTNPSTLVYQFHSGGTAERLIEVRDNGAPIATYTTSLAAGTFTLTSAPVGQITADVQGEKPSGTYRNDVSRLVQQIVTAYGPSATRFSAGDLDATNLSAFATACPQPVGIYLSDRANVLAVCQQLASSVGAQVVCTTTGLLRLIRLAIPGSATWSVTAQDMEVASLHIAERPPVAATCKLAYCRNFTPQTSGLAGGLPASSAAALAAESITVTSTDATTATTYKLDTAPVQEETLLLTESDATTEAARRRDLWKTQRNVYAATYFSHLMLAELGDGMTITHARFGLAAGKTGLITRINRDWFKGRIEIGVLA